LITWISNFNNNENGKSGFIRLIDVFFIGPYLMTLANKQKTENAKFLLYVIGGATILYNGVNYIKYNANTKTSN
jgi:hypothetical protein